MTKEDIPPVLAPSINRRAEVQAAYVEHMEKRRANEDTSCDMCRLIHAHPLEVAFENKITSLHFNSLELEHICVIENEYPYEIYDGRQLIAHHMLVPKEHYSTASNLPGYVKQEFRDTIDLLLDNGFYDGTFTRSTHSPTSSVPGHLHTHLVKLGAPVIRQHYDPSQGRNDVEFESTGF